MTIAMNRTATGTATHSFWEVTLYGDKTTPNGWDVVANGSDTGATISTDLTVGNGVDPDDEVTVIYFNSGGDRYTADVTIP